MEKEFKTKQTEYLRKLLPDNIWTQLGIDLTKLTFQYDTMFSGPGMNLGALAKQGQGTSFQYIATGELTISNQGHEYKAGVSMVAYYLTSHQQDNNPSKVKVIINDHEVKLYRPSDSAQWSKLNLIALSETLRKFIALLSSKRTSSYEEKKLQVRQSLEADDLSSERCEAFIAKLERSTWPRQDVKDLLERARVRLDKVKAHEADVNHDQQLLDRVWQMAKDHVAEWEAYGLACKEWAEKVIEEYWHPFTLFALRFAVSGNNSETVYCPPDQTDDDGYLKMVAPDGTIIEKRFCRPISWQKETFDKRPSSESKSYCHYQITTKCRSRAVSLPPANVHDRQIDPIEISSSQPSPLMSWSKRIESVYDRFINKGRMELVDSLGSEEIAQLEKSTWLKKIA